MSKITTAKKEAKLKGKQAKIAAAASRKAAAEVEEPKAAKSSIPNYGKCCTCSYYAKPCKKTKKYTARKAENTCYKCKA